MRHFKRAIVQGALSDRRRHHRSIPAPALQKKHADMRISRKRIEPGCVDIWGKARVQFVNSQTIVSGSTSTHLLRGYTATLVYPRPV
ncbi:MAG: hypothetical protein CMM00_01350 [Rhodopirellula sp.]|nr:hypothetical protein [Rhodopirellula sp.]